VKADRRSGAGGDASEDARRFLRASGMCPDDLDAEREVRAFLAEMDLGLAGSHSSLRMLPTFIEVDRDVPHGRPVLAIDAGGTNLRVTVIEVGSDGKARLTAFRRERMPGTAGEISSRDFFADGSTFHGLPTFRGRGASCLAALLGDRASWEIAAVEHAALVGAAVCALTN
jgi:hexokinase